MKGDKPKMKKLISVTLILMLVLALGCTAFADSGVPITKNPTDEVRSAGGTAWFVSGAYNYNSAEWKFMDPNGTFMNAQEFRNRFPYATVTGENSTNLTVRNLGTDMNGYGVICTFYNNNGPTDTTMAFLYVSAAPVYTAPTYTAPVNTTPSYYIPYGATDGGYTYDENGHLEYDVYYDDGSYTTFYYDGSSFTDNLDGSYVYHSNDGSIDYFTDGGYSHTDYADGSYMEYHADGSWESYDASTNTYNSGTDSIW